MLAQRHGCWIAIHEIANAVYEHRPLRDGDRIDVGNIALDVFHTPGHRPEHCCIVVSDRTRGDEPWLVLSGDALFVGDSGRPDLAVAGDEGARRALPLPARAPRRSRNGVELFPGHVAGSLCGRGMSAKTSSTLGFERRFNPMLAEMTVDQFVKLANADLAPKPPTMARIVELNRGPLLVGAPPAARIVAQPPDGRPGARRARRRELRGRPHRRIVQRLRRGLGIRQPLRLRARPRARGRDRGRDAPAGGARPRASSAAVGFEQLAEVGFGIDSAHALVRFAPVGLAEMGALADRRRAAGGRRARGVRADRDGGRGARGALPAAGRRPISRRSTRRSPTAVVCHTGARSPLSASLLARRGFTRVRPVLGEGMGGWAAREHEAAAAAAAKSSARASAKAKAEAGAEAARAQAPRLPRGRARAVQPLNERRRRGARAAVWQELGDGTSALAEQVHAERLRP